ncbi:regulatory protein TetR (plasmid) [Deinococcus proteolyticus MRP]|uniref:Regulatory protein TetR n=1 Tax=Deinococcus proteolyticus (strain ATCC 35074 / DSM 20540 / JCM 6276 / NBRC 101906 / NCIMB 13154 / VKM Ac-1939 / CCM 2703 / MRP) TaxID=693977 RepID=F0RRC1_DEIPM|nr:TetR/AcrR family transcriptional regulator [Deinococcus proteolyticus]ADY27830.1 regulatory protein TetR [Deinococcus proteolyticus MRP]
MTAPSMSKPTAVQQRTFEHLITTAERLMNSGTTPSVAELAEAASVSRATAYRYFSSQADIVSALASHTMIPIRYWEPVTQDARARLHELLDFTFSQLTDAEVHHWAILQVHLTNWAEAYPEQATPNRGHRRELLWRAVEPLVGQLPQVHLERLVQTLSPFFGIELFLVFRDMWGLDDSAVLDRAHWMIDSLYERALADAAGSGHQSKEPPK